MEIANTIITILAILASIAAWVAKIRWSKEYTAAKEEIIRAKDEQIKVLKLTLERIEKFNSQTIWDYAKKQKAALEEIIKDLEEQLEKKKKEIERLSAEATSDKDELAELNEQVKELEQSLSEFEEAKKSVDTGTETAVQSYNDVVAKSMSNISKESMKNVRKYIEVDEPTRAPSKKRTASILEWMNDFVSDKTDEM